MESILENDFRLIPSNSKSCMFDIDLFKEIEIREKGKVVGKKMGWKTVAYGLRLDDAVEYVLTHKISLISEASSLEALLKESIQLRKDMKKVIDKYIKDYYGK